MSIPYIILLTAGLMLGFWFISSYAFHKERLKYYKEIENLLGWDKAGMKVRVIIRHLKQF